MSHVRDVFAEEDLARMIEGGFVRTQVHPTAPYTILNYTERTQFEKEWNAVTVACRGLVVDEYDTVIARPFGKFFNYGEHEGKLPDGTVTVTEKMDGSLGILYPLPDGSFAIATRGSFTSVQAQHATEVWKTRYAASFAPNTDWTYLFEVIYPDNRIVVNYGELDDLVLLGAVNRETGRSVPLEHARQGWPGPVVQVLEYTTIAAALAAPARTGVEGCVVHFVDADVRVKIKEAEYVRLHKLVTGMSERRVWEALANGDDLDVLLHDVPDEFFEFVTTTRNALLARFDGLSCELHQRHASIVSALGDGFARRDYALAVNAIEDFDLAKALFGVLDGRDVSEAIWKHLRPPEHVLWTAKTDS